MKHLRLVVDNTKNEIVPYIPEEVLDSSEDHQVPLLDLKEELGNEMRNGWLGWVAVAGVVGVWDVSRNETMTNAFKRGREHQIGRYAVAGATAYVVGHLYDLIPERYDIFDQLARRFKRG